MLPTEPYELQIIHWSNECPAEELCGVLMRHRETFMPVQISNVAKDRRATFTMEEGPFLEAVNSGQIWGTWHVHPGQQDEDGPSLADMDRANAWNLPGCILVRRTMQFRYYLPNGYKVSIFRRPYVPGVFDCHALVKQALVEYVGFDAIDLDREKLDPDGCYPNLQEEWERQGWELLLQPKPGRVAMINFYGRSRCNHLGLVISSHEMLHQLRGHPSRVDYLGSWTKWALGYLSHPAIEAKVKAENWDRLPFNPQDYEGPRRPAKASRSPQDAFSARPRGNIAGGPLDPEILRRIKP
jgi:proteasome lid subunit RPN8/RPN11